MFNKKTVFLLLSMMVATNCFAVCPSGQRDINIGGVETCVVDHLFEVNTTVNSACQANYLGVTSTPDGSAVDMNPEYMIETWICPQGYYVPEGAEHNNAQEGENPCVLCEENHWCPGGTYVYDSFVDEYREAHPTDTVAANTDSIQDCDTGLVSPAGTFEALGCGKKMGVDGEYIYLTQKKYTTPAMAARIADSVYHARMTEGSKKMNGNTDKKFKTKLNGRVYSIHDITADSDNTNNTTQGD